MNQTILGNYCYLSFIQVSFNITNIIFNANTLNLYILSRWEQYKKAYVDVKKSDNLSVDTIAEGVEKVRNRAAFKGKGDFPL